MYQIIGLSVPLAGIAMIFGIVYLGVTSENRKNLAMIEAGMNPNEGKGNKRKTLRAALLLIFIPLGIIVGNYLEDIIGSKYSNISGLVMAFLFGGIALLIFHFIDKRMTEKEEREEHKNFKG